MPSMAAPKGTKRIYNPSTGELFLPNPSKAMQSVQDLRKKILNTSQWPVLFTQDVC